MFIILYIIIICWNFVVESTHFYGGTVTWKPMNNTANGSTIAVMFTQSYQWRRSFSGAGCNQSTITNQSPLIPNAGDKLTCTTSSCGGYSPISINEYCTDFSVLVDSSSGQISTVENIAAGSTFCVAYSNKAWIQLYSTNCGSSGRKKRGPPTSTTSTIAPSGCYTSNAKWSVGTCIDLTVRPDGFINTPPLATIISPIKVPVNSLTDINIPVIDADNDYLQCRWAANTTDLDECGDVCQAAPGSTLDGDNCTLTFNSTGKNVGEYFAVTLMVEDFYNSTTDIPFSRVPIQFLIYITNQTNCSSKPTINSTLPACSPIEVGMAFNFSLTIISGCPGTTVTDVYTMPPENLEKVSFLQNGTDNVWILSETWTPTALQLGSQAYCAVATDSANVQSDQYCTTFTVVPAGSGSLCPGETSTTTSTTTTTTRTTSTTSSSTSSTTTTSTTTTSTSTSSTSSTSTSSTTTTTSSSTSTSSTSTSTSSSTSTSTTSSTTSTTSTSTSTSTTSSTTSTTSTSTTTSTTSTTTSTSTSTSTTSSTTTSTSTSTTTTSVTTTSTTSVTTTTVTTVTTTSVTTVTTFESTTATNTKPINIPLIVGLSLLGLLALLALCCCCCWWWRLYGKPVDRRQQKQNEEDVASKYLPFNKKSSRKPNPSSTNKTNQIFAFDPDDHSIPRSRAITINSLEYHPDQNLDRRTIIDKTQSQKGKTSSDGNVVRTSQVSKPSSVEEHTTRSTPVHKTNDLSVLDLSKIAETKLRSNTIGSIPHTSSVRVIKVHKTPSSNRPSRDESLLTSSKMTAATNAHLQSNELKRNHSASITVTKIKHVDLPPPITNSSNHETGKLASKPSYSIRQKTDELFPKPDLTQSNDVGKTKRSSTFTIDAMVIRLKRSDLSSDMPNQPSDTITAPKNRSSANFQENIPLANATRANVIVTKVARRKSFA